MRRFVTTVQLIIIDLLHFLFIVLEVLVIVLTLCVLALLIVIWCLQNYPCETQWLASRSSKSIHHRRCICLALCPHRKDFGWRWVISWRHDLWVASTDSLAPKYLLGGSWLWMAFQFCLETGSWSQLESWLITRKVPDISNIVHILKHISTKIFAKNKLGATEHLAPRQMYVGCLSWSITMATMLDISPKQYWGASLLISIEEDGWTLTVETINMTCQLGMRIHLCNAEMSEHVIHWLYSAFLCSEATGGQAIPSDPCRSGVSRC